jgi:hypothetical protein
MFKFAKHAGDARRAARQFSRFHHRPGKGGLAASHCGVIAASLPAQDRLAGFQG